MERMHKSMNTYIQSLSKRTDTDSKEKTLPITNTGTIMIAHGNDFEPDSEFGQCLASRFKPVDHAVMDADAR